MTRIVVGVDGSHSSNRALEWAAREAESRGATLCVLHAWHPAYVSGSPLAPAPIDPQVFEKAAQATLDEAVATVDADKLPGPIEKRLVACQAAAALIGASEDAELVVVGARGLGGFMGLLLGSVSHQVLSHASCPVVVVPTAR